MNATGILNDARRRVWRYQRVLWWLFAVNLVLALFGVYPGAEQLGKILNRSQHAAQLTDSFDLFTFVELASKPEVQLESGNHTAIHFSLVFFAFSLFLTGGIIEAYRVGRKLTMVEFFHACSAYFWRWVRLLICLLIILAPLVFLAASLNEWSDKLSDDAPQERLGFYVLTAGMILVALAAMTVRLWFDLAQVITVFDDERRVRRALASSFRIFRKNFTSLFWMYFRISFVAWLAMSVALLIWTQIPGRHFEWSILVLEILVFSWFVTRLWQRAAEVTWYERWQTTQIRYTEAVSVRAAAPALQ